MWRHCPKCMNKHWSVVEVPRIGIERFPIESCLYREEVQKRSFPRKGNQAQTATPSNTRFLQRLIADGLFQTATKPSWVWGRNDWLKGEIGAYPGCWKICCLANIQVNLLTKKGEECFYSAIPTWKSKLIPDQYKQLFIKKNQLSIQWKKVIPTATEKGGQEEDESYLFWCFRKKRRGTPRRNV